MATLEKTAKIIANAFGRGQNGMPIRVFISGTAAYTDGNIIVLPVDVNVDGKRRIRLLGYLLHESGHIKFTDFKRAPSNLVNAIEDARIEGEVKKLYAGAGYFLDGLNKDLLGELIAKTGDPLPSHPMGRIATYVEACLAAHHSPVMADYARRVRNRMRNILGVERHEKLMALLATMPASTQEVWDLSHKIEKLLSTKPKRQKRNSPQQGDSGTESPNKGKESLSGSSQNNSSESANSPQGTSSKDDKTDGEGNAEKSTPSQEEGSSQCQSNSDGSSSGNEESVPEPQGTSPKDDKADGEGNAEKSTPSQEEGSSQCQSNSDGSSSSDEESVPEDESTALSDVFSSCKGKSYVDVPLEVAKAKDFEGEQALSAFDMLNMEECKLAKNPQSNFNRGEQEKRTYAYPILSDTLEMIEKGKLLAASLGRSLTGLAQAKSRDFCRLSKTGRRISSRHLARLSTLNTRVFERKDAKIRRDTAVAILLDRSGSMASKTLSGEPCIKVGLEATIAVKTALDRLTGVKSCAEVFPSTVNNKPLECIIEFGEAVEKCVQTIQVASDASGGTPFTEAVLLASNRLMCRREARKIVLVFTDGFFKVGDEIEMCLKAGIEVAVVSLGYEPTNREKLSAFVSINNMDTLTDTFFELAKTLQIGVAQAR